MMYHYIKKFADSVRFKSEDGRKDNDDGGSRVNSFFAT